MLKKVLIGIGIVVGIFIIWSVYGLFFATPVSPPATATYNQDGLEITIEYSQPSKKGRLIFGSEEDGALQPYGKYWRLGANAPTEITINKDVNFGGKSLEAGTYKMYAIPGPDAFKVILNSETGGFFGAVEPDPELDIMTVEAAVQKPMAEVETFTIDFASTDLGVDIVFSWDQSVFTVPVTM